MYYIGAWEQNTSPPKGHTSKGQNQWMIVLGYTQGETSSQIYAQHIPRQPRVPALADHMSFSRQSESQLCFQIMYYFTVVDMLLFHYNI